MLQVGTSVRPRDDPSTRFRRRTEHSVLCRHRKPQSKEAERQNGFGTGTNVKVK